MAQVSRRLRTLLREDPQMALKAVFRNVIGA
jgi:hypothetical protein